MVGDNSNNAVQVVSSGAANSFTIIGLGGTQLKMGAVIANSFTINAATAGMNANLSNGDDTLIIDGSGTNDQLSIVGAVANNMARGNDTFYGLHLDVTKALNLNGGAGDSQATVTESNYAGNMNWNAYGGDDTFAISDTFIQSALTANAGIGNDSLVMDHVIVIKQFRWNAASGDDTLSVADSRVDGATFMNLATGADTTTISGSRFANFTWNGGKDANSLAVSDTTFSGNFVARSYAGDDTMIVVRSNFLGKARFDGGPGLDTLDAGTLSFPAGMARGNVFVGALTVLGFENILS